MSRNSEHDQRAMQNGENERLPRREQVLACNFATWYATFSQLPAGIDTHDGRTNVTMRSVVINLPASFIQFLQADGIALPPQLATSNLWTPAHNGDDWSTSSDDDDDDAVPLTGDQDEDRSSKAQFFSTTDWHDLHDAIQAAMASLGGRVVPKLNWSSPQDATWVSGVTNGSGSLCCQTVGDVLLLLQASDFVSFDLDHAWQDVVDNNAPGHDNNVDDDDEHHCAQSSLSLSFPYQLVLRKWCHLYPSHEFRCFVQWHQLRAVSQRHASSCYDHLRQSKYDLLPIIADFLDNVVLHRFADGNVANYVVDVYVDRHDRVWIVDFNVWASRTDALLFTWSELEALPLDGAAILRVVETDKQVRHDPLASYKAPIDTIHLAAAAGGGGLMGEDAVRFDDFMKLCERPTVLEQELRRDAAPPSSPRTDENVQDYKG